MASILTKHHNQIIDDLKKGFSIQEIAFNLLETHNIDITRQSILFYLHKRNIMINKFKYLCNYIKEMNLQNYSARKLRQILIDNNNIKISLMTVLKIKKALNEKSI